MKIVNDETIIDHSPILIKNGYNPFRYVLRHVPESYEPYVIHEETMKLASDGNTWVHDSFFNGRYYESLDVASDDFQQRYYKSW